VPGPGGSSTSIWAAAAITVHTAKTAKLRSSPDIGFVIISRLQRQIYGKCRSLSDMRGGNACITSGDGIPTSLMWHLFDRRY
jgi:hypothetical protein